MGEYSKKASNSWHLSSVTANERCDPHLLQAVVFQDKDGTIKATGAGLFKDTRSWFTQDFRERFQDVLPSGQPTQLSSGRPVKRCRASVDNPDKRKAAVEVLSDYSNTQQATVQYWQILTSCPQNDWRVIGEAWIELIEPDKRRLYPYSRGDDAKPKWWPRRLRHETPHHLLTNGGSPLLSASQPS
jgi:hypothetical protein